MTHWTENASREYVSGNPLWGYIGECPDGRLWLPAWRQTGPHRDEPLFNRLLNLRRPTHWLPYLRSRLTKRLAWLDD